MSDLLGLVAGTVLGVIVAFLLLGIGWYIKEEIRGDDE